MRTFFRWLLLAPVLIVALVFCVVNRQTVDIIFDPFGNPHSGLAVRIPLFLALIAAIALGVLIGGAVTWIGQVRHRREARAARAELARLRNEQARRAILISDRSAA